MLLPLVETDEEDDDDDALSTALGLTAGGSDAPPASTIALDHPVDGSNAPPASTTALRLPADGSDLSEEGDATDAGSDGNNVVPAGIGATDAPRIPPVQQSTFFPIFRRGNARIRQSPATTATGRNETSVSTKVDGGLGTTALADRPPAARNASESGDTAATTSSLLAAVARASTSASAGARGVALGQTLAALPATTSPDAEA